MTEAIERLTLVVFLPALAGLALVFVADHRRAAWINVGASTATFLVSLSLFSAGNGASAWFLLDDFNIYLLALTTFVGATTSLFSASYIIDAVDTGKLRPAYLRFYHAMYQAFMFTMLLALAANNLGVMWVAVEGATLTTVLMVSLYRTPEAIEAAWKYFILCGVGIALALFGTILMYIVAQPAMGSGTAAMTWSVLLERVNEFNPALLNLAFVFLLIGYGTKAGLAPLHAWLPDAHAEGPTPISAVLSGLLLNVALYAVLRFKMLLAANGYAIAAGPLMVTMGLGSMILAGLMLYRRRDIKRLFAYSSVEHMGIATFAFGMGGPLANFAGLLHMTMHSLTKSAIFFAVGHITQNKGTQQIARIRGLTLSHPRLGWALVAGVLAIAGAPPFGLFMSEFLIVSSTFARTPLLALPVVLALLLAFGALVMRMQGLAFGAPSANEQEHPGPQKPVPLPALIPLYGHLALVLVAGIWLPEPLVDWFHAVAKLLG